MLRQRIITAAIAALVVLFAIFALPTAAFAVGLAIVLLVGAWEWGMLGRLDRIPSRAMYVAVLGAIGGLAALLMAWHGWVPLLLTGACLNWLYLGWRVGNYDRNPDTGIKPTGVRVLGALVLVPTWVALVWLHGRPDLGPALVLMTLSLVWAADTGAYFAGRRWGRRKLAPRVSPGKTREGAYGGLMAVVAVAIAGGIGLGIGGSRWLPFVLLCVVCFLASILGDLLESMIKRQRGVKDSGTILPGHGGVMDRIDSLTAAAPVFAWGMLWILP
jgi:phosphatidate cytidylyltransferase